MPSERGRDLDAAIAREVMGGASPICHATMYKLWNHRSESSTGPTHIQEPPEEWDVYLGYSSDRNAARLVLQEIERLGLSNAFLGAIDYILWPEMTVMSDRDPAMEYMMASPEAICLAALSAVRGDKG